MAVSTYSVENYQVATWFNESAGTDISVIPAPASGSRIRILSIHMAANGSSGRFQLHWGAVASANLIFQTNLLSNSHLGPVEMVVPGPLATALQMTTAQGTSGTIRYEIA